MKTQHTPGPWKVRKYEGCLYIEADRGKRWDNPTICNLYDDVTPEDSVTIGNWYEPHENSEANASLIAAAPELLELLHDCLVYVTDTIDCSDDKQLIAKARQDEGRIRAAIAKANGDI